MPSSRRQDIADALHRRILRALQVGALGPGDKLPGTRELAVEFDADPRVVAAACRTLAADGLIELRPRSGIYVHPSLNIVRSRPTLSIPWMAQVFAQGIARGVRPAELPRTLNAALGNTSLRTVVVAPTVDQVRGLCRELQADFGLDVRGVLGSTLNERRDIPWIMRRARVLLATDAYAQRVAAIAEQLKKRFVKITAREDLFDAEWSLLRSEEAFVLVADTGFARFVRAYLDRVHPGNHIQVLLAGRDAIARIPAEAPVYATQAARDALGAIRLPKGLLPHARMLSEECTTEILRTMLEEAST